MITYVIYQLFRAGYKVLTKYFFLKKSALDLVHFGLPLIDFKELDFQCHIKKNIVH